MLLCIFGELVVIVVVIVDFCNQIDKMWVVSCIFFIQFFLFNLLFTSWIALKKNSTTIVILGLILDITLITGVNFIFGADRIDFLLFYLIPLFFSVANKNLNVFVYILSLISIALSLYLKNGNTLFFAPEIVRYTVLSLSLYTIFFLLIKYIVHSTYLDAIRKVALLFHEIRNSLTVILGYINLLNNEKVTDEQRHFFYNAIESATQRIKTICDQYITQKKPDQPPKN